MAEFLLVPIHIEALFVPKRNGASRESKVPPRISQQKNKQNKGQGKKQGSNNTPDETHSQSLQNLKLDLQPGVHLHWFLPHALTGNVVEKQTTSFRVVPKCWLVTRQGRTGVKQWITGNDCLHPDGERRLSHLFDETEHEWRILHRILSPLGRNMSLDE